MLTKLAQEQVKRTRVRNRLWTVYKTAAVIITVHPALCGENAQRFPDRHAAYLEDIGQCLLADVGIRF